ncbi:MAG: LysR family transcriptional regulator [Deltaproteobacteria bacterium]|nr:LysR family transcriptional regulator [Deltaproteobacteria bacterium]
MPNFAALRYAAAAARTGSFTGAAQECGVAQPTVSNAIAALEEELGARIFERGARGLAPTPAGRTLLPLVDAVLAAVGDLERGAHALAHPEQQVLRLGFSPLVGARIGLLMQPFAREHRDVDVIYKECTVDDIEARLAGNTVDIAFGVGLGRGKDRGRQVLYRERLRYVAAGGAANTETIDVHEVARRRLLLTVGVCGLAAATRALFERHRLVLDEYRGQAMSYGVLQEWADLGIGGAMLPESLIRGGPHGHPVVMAGGKPVTLTFEAVWRKDLLVAAHVIDAVRYLRTIVPTLARGMALTSPASR